MSWAEHIAAQVELAMPRVFPTSLRDTTADYATVLAAGDWCLMKEDENSIGYKIGVITHVVACSQFVRLVHVHQCGRDLAGERDFYAQSTKTALNYMNTARGPNGDMECNRRITRHNIFKPHCG
jgi:hypothetical protein